MAANDYYQSFHQPQTQQAPPPYPSTPPPPQAGYGRRPSLAPVQSPHNFSPQPSNYTQQNYLQIPGQGGYQAPVPYAGPPPAYPNNNNYALTPMRSKSEPPENRRPSVDEYGSSRHSRHHSKHRDSRSRSRSRSRRRDYDDDDYSASSGSRSRSRHHSHHRKSSHSGSHHRKRSHSGRDTFLGAGAGGIVGDAILPGLGTLLGAAFGGVGGHEYSHRKDERKRRESRSHSDSGYRGDGITVKSGWIRR